MGETISGDRDSVGVGILVVRGIILVLESVNIPESAMKHISLDAHHESVQRFVMDLSIDSNASVLELNGRALACVLPMSKGANGRDDRDDWNEIKNARRRILIDQEISGTLDAADAAELECLQKEMLRHRRRVAPLPLEEARALHQQLMAQAQQDSRSGS